MPEWGVASGISPIGWVIKGMKSWRNIQDLSRLDMLQHRGSGWTLETILESSVPTAQAELLRREVRAPASVLGQLNKCLGHQGTLGMYMDSRTREVLKILHDSGLRSSLVLCYEEFQIPSPRVFINWAPSLNTLIGSSGLSWHYVWHLAKHLNCELLIAEKGSRRPLSIMQAAGGMCLKSTFLRIPY